MPRGYSFKVMSGSMGCFLDPPGSAQYNWHVRETRGGHECGAQSLQSASVDEFLPEPVRLKARKLLADAPVQCTEEWLRQVYAHFRHCYSPDGVNRRASDCLIVKDAPLPDPATHLGVMFVRTWFPDHEVRTDLM